MKRPLPSPPSIPLLTSGAYTAGSYHTTSLPPTLISSSVDGDSVSFEWTAPGSGSAVYKVTAIGSVVFSGWDDEVGAPHYDRSKLAVRCTCPSGKEQRMNTLRSGKVLYVCKHARSALDGVCDPDGTKAIEGMRRERVELLKREKDRQEEEHPGERARITALLAGKTYEEIADALQAALKTFAGLSSLTALFPASPSSALPSPTLKTCGRCSTDYDPNGNPASLVCRKYHPDDSVNMVWESSKKCYSECGDCGRTFGLDGYNSWTKNGPREEGDTCYETEHVPLEEYDGSNDPFVKNLKR